MLVNIVKMGTVLDPQRYTEGEGGLEDEPNSGISSQEMQGYIGALVHAERLMGWIDSKVEMALIDHGADSGLDGHTTDTRLHDLSTELLVQQCKTLVLHKQEAERLEIEAEHQGITCTAIKAALEKDFEESEEFERLWYDGGGSSTHWFSEGIQDEG